MTETDSNGPGRVTGIGGIFFKSADPRGATEWYMKHLGMPTGPGGCQFTWRHPSEPDAERLTVWAPFPDTTTYFDPSPSAFMINYIVDDLDALLAKLSAAGVRIDPKRDDHEYGRFAWIFDPDGNKIELWQPR